MVVVLVYTHADVIFPKEGIPHDAKPLPAKSSLPPTPIATKHVPLPTPKERDTISPPTSPRSLPTSPFDTKPPNATSPSVTSPLHAKNLPAIPSKLANSNPSKAAQERAQTTGHCEPGSLNSSGSVSSRPESPRLRLESERDLMSELEAKKSPRNDASLNAQVYTRLLECKETLGRLISLIN